MKHVRSNYFQFFFLLLQKYFHLIFMFNMQSNNKKKTRQMNELSDFVSNIKKKILCSILVNSHYFFFHCISDHTVHLALWNANFNLFIIFNGDGLRWIEHINADNGQTTFMWKGFFEHFQNAMKQNSFQVRNESQYASIDHFHYTRTTLAVFHFK